MKISTRRDALFAQLQTVTRAASTRSAVQALSGVQLPAHGRRHRAARHRHGDRPARPARGRGRPRRRRRAAGAAARRRRPCAARRRGLARAARRRSRTSRSSAGSATFHIRTLRLEDFPPFPEPEGDGGSRCRAPRSSRPCSRSPARPRATRRARCSPASSSPRPASELRMVATDSYRLSVKETKLEAPLAGLVRGQRAGAGAAGADADRPARPRPSQLARLGAREPGRLRGRRRRAVVAADRRPVPELPPAAAGRLRARAAAGRRRDHRGRAPHLAARAEERAAAAGVRRGRADGVGAHARRRRGPASRCRSRSRASRSRSASTPSSCATGSRRWSRATSCSS